MVKITNIKHRLYMPPIKKYEVYGKFPWKLVVQLLLITFTTCQVIFIVNRSTTYSYNQYTLWNKLFLNKDVQGSDTTITNSYNIFGINSLKNFVQETVDNYYDINSVSIDDYKYMYKSDGRKKPPKLSVEYFNNEKSLRKGFKIEYDLYINDIGPFEDSQDIQDFMEGVKSFDIKFNLIHSLDKYVQLASDCYDWELTQKYDFTYHGPVQTSLDTKRTNCGGIYRNIIRNYVWINISVTFLGFFSLALIISYFQKRLEILEVVMGISTGTVRAWENMGLKEKLKLFNFWTIIAIFGNLFQIFGAVLSIFEPNSDIKVNEIIIGFGCFFAWIGGVRYLNKRTPSYTIVNVVRRSSPVISMYIFGVVPCVMGFTFLAMCYFWQTGIYPNTPMSLIANYAVVNGDSVYVFALAEYQESALMGQLYSYAFVVFFICCVHNLFIAIIERSYSSLKRSPIDNNDSSDDEGEEEVVKEKKRLIEMQEMKKRQSLRAFQKIINLGRQDSSAAYDEQTLVHIQNMDNLTEELIKKIKILEQKASTLKGNQDAEVIYRHFINIVENQLEPVITHFK